MPVRVRFRDLSLPDGERAALLEAIDALMRRGDFILGETVTQFETEFALRCHQPHAIGVSDGTGALYLSLRGLGVGVGDEVITTPMSWVATGNAILALGATPVFADVADDFNIDPAAIEAAVTPRTKAILPVHFYGRMARMDEIMGIARRHSLAVVEDAAQAFGADLDGRPAGSFGDAGAFSLNPMKPLAALGEAGAIVTPHADLAERIHSLRYLGTINRETCVDPTLNFKIDTLQALVLLHRMQDVERIVAARNAVALRYSDGLADVVRVPAPSDRGTSAFFDYTVIAEDRDRLESFLLADGIEVKVRHRLLLTQQPGYPPLHCSVPRAEALVQGILSLPIHEKLTDDDVDIVIDGIRRFYGVS
jgi:dTDP-4-amino-4,6-dideoxygalactose transaminase